MCIKGIIFDKDGTLFDFQSSWGTSTFNLLLSLSDGNSAILEALGKALKFNLKQKVFYPDSIFISGTARQTMALISPIVPKKSEADILAAQKFHYSNLKQQPVKDLYKILNHLSELGYLLNIATNDLETSTISELKEVGVYKFFNSIIGADSGYGSKPEPSQLIAISQIISLESSEIIMVGDSVNDMVAAKKAHFTAIGVLTGVASKQDLQPFSDVVLDDISHLLPWIETQNSTKSSTK